MKQRYGLLQRGARNANESPRRNRNDSNQTCEQGIANCIYNVCYRGRPVVSWTTHHPCGQIKGFDCPHEACMDPLRKFALGTRIDLDYQVHLNHTGSFTETFGYHYMITDDSVTITRELNDKKFVPRLRNIDWKKMQALISIDDKGTGPFETFHSIKIKKILFPKAKETFALFLLFLYNIIFKKNQEKGLRNPRKQQKKTILFCFLSMFALLCIALIPTAVGQQQKLKNNFLYEKLNTAIVNPSYLYIGRRYISCDLLESKESLYSLLKVHKKICDATFEKPQNSLIADANEDFILLNKKHSFEHAKHLCKKFNSSPVEIRTVQMAQKVNKFLGRNNIPAIWAGIEYSYNIAEPIFMSDSTLAAHTVYTNIDYTKGTFSNKSDWQTTVHLGSHHEHGLSFTYEKSNSEIATIRAHINPTHVRKQRQKNFKDVGFARQESVVCKKPKNFENIAPFGWQESCKQRNNQMNIKFDIAIKKINEIMPSNLPQKPRPFMPFITIDNTRTSRVKRSIEYENLQQDAQTKWQELVSQEELPLDKQCIAIQSAQTNKRSLGAIFKFVTTVISAAKLILRLYPVISAVASLGKSTSRSQRHSNQIYPLHSVNSPQKPNFQIINYLEALQEESRFIDTMFEENQNITFSMLKEREINQDFNDVCQYIDKTYQKLVKIIYEDDFKPQNPLDFMTPQDFQDIIIDVKRIYGVNLHNNLKLVKTYITNSKNSYILTTAIPIEEDGTLSDIFRIHQLPAIDKEFKYIPKTTVEYLAITHHSEHFIPLDGLEATSCAKNGICSARNPTFSKDMASCEVANFFDNNIANCEYKISNDTNPVFFILQNRTYYSTGKPIKITIECKNRIFQQAGSDRTQELNGIGFFEIPVSCQAHYKSMILRPATRNLEFIHQKIRPVIKLTAQPFAKLTEFIENIKTNFKPPNIPTHIWNKYVLPLIITITTITLSIIIFLIAFCLCLKHPCGRQCCLATCTKYRNYEIAAVERLHNETRIMTELDNIRMANDTKLEQICPSSRATSPPPFPEPIPETPIIRPPSHSKLPPPPSKQ